MEFSDFDLVRGIKSGDDSAMDILVRRWYPRVYGYVFKVVGHQQDAYDITQDTFIAMMRNINSYYPWKKFDSWILTVAHNKCMDYFRMQRRRIPAESFELDCVDFSSSPEEAVTVSVAVNDALNKLPPVQKEAIILYYFRQFTAAEIAQMTGTPLPTVKSRLAAARKKLAVYLREEFK